MFGSFRKHVTQQTIDMVRQPYAMFQRFYGTPPDFWQDEFVLGFFGVMIGLLSKFLSQGKLSQTDNGLLLQDVFGALSNMNGAAVTRRFTELAFERPPSADFKLGGDHGEIVTLALLGKSTPAGREAVEQAKQEAASQGSTGDIGAIAAILIMKLFVQPLSERFDGQHNGRL